MQRNLKVKSRKRFDNVPITLNVKRK